MNPRREIAIRIDVGKPPSRMYGYPAHLQFLADGGIEIWGAKDLDPRLVLRLDDDARRALIVALGGQA